MSKTRIVLLALGGLVLLGLAAGFVAHGFAFGSGDEVRSLKWQDRDRHYRLHKPADLDTSRPLPLVLVLHGAGSNGLQTEFLTLNSWNELAEKEGFIVAYPDGVGSRWNDGRADATSPAVRQKVDDVGFLTALVARLSSEFNVDPRRVFATGISNGAMMSYRLACEAPETFAAVGPVAGAMSEALAPSCSSSRPVSVVALSGVHDPLVPWAGGQIELGRQKRGAVMPVPDSLRFWASKNGCPPAPAATREPDRDPRDGTLVTRHAWGPCRDGSEVVLYTIDGGGHTWPGGVQYLPAFIIGRTSRDVDATEVIWNFFKVHGRS